MAANKINKALLAVLFFVICIIYCCKKLQFPAIIQQAVIVAALFLFAFSYFWRGFFYLGSAFVLFYYFSWRLEDYPIPAPQSCSLQALVIDFPERITPKGSKLKLKISDNNCQNKLPKIIFAHDYKNNPEQYIYGASYNFLLNFNGKTRSANIKNKQIISEKSAFYRNFRLFFQEKIKEVYPQYLQKWLEALLLGNRSDFNRWDWEKLQRTGTSHLMAISGMHLAILSAFVYFFGKFIALPFRNFITPRTFALSLAAIFAIFYALIASANPPIIRATLLLIVLFAHWIFPRIPVGLEALILAAILQLIVFPEDLFRASAYLSYLAVALILFLSPKLKNLSFWKQYIYLQFAIIFTLTPLTWAVFGGISIIAPIANLILLPWLPVILFGAIWGLFLPIIAEFITFLTTYFLATIEYLSALEWSYFEPNCQISLFNALFFNLLIFTFLENFKYKKYLFFIILTSLFGQFSFSKIPDLIIKKSSYPLALIESEGKYFIINGGNKPVSSDRDDFRYYFLTELRKNGVKPSALILTTDKVSAHLAISTVKKIYPETEVFSLVEQAKNFPYDYDLCPENNKFNLNFKMINNKCILELKDYLLNEKTIIKNNS